MAIQNFTEEKKKTHVDFLGYISATIGHYYFNLVFPKTPRDQVTDQICCQN